MIAVKFESSVQVLTGKILYRGKAKHAKQVKKFANYKVGKISSYHL
jgi:hypothetical protein